MKEASSLKAVYEKLREFHKERDTYDEDYEMNIDWYEELLSTVPNDSREDVERFIREVGISHIDIIFLFIDVLFNKAVPVEK